MIVHISTIPNMSTLIPKIPELAVEMYEDKSIPRVCFATSIDGALSALQYLGGDFYVYAPVVDDDFIFYHPTNEQVVDSSITGEIWSLVPISVKCIGVIHAEPAKKDNFIPIKIIRYGKEEMLYFHNYEWKWVERENGYENE